QNPVKAEREEGAHLDSEFAGDVEPTRSSRDSPACEGEHSRSKAPGTMLRHLQGPQQEQDEEVKELPLRTNYASREIIEQQPIDEHGNGRPTRRRMEGGDARGDQSERKCPQEDIQTDDTAAGRALE